jgi:hypothetical protein
MWIKEKWNELFIKLVVRPSKEIVIDEKEDVPEEVKIIIESMKKTEEYFEVTYCLGKKIFKVNVFVEENDMKINDVITEITNGKKQTYFISREMQRKIAGELLKLDQFRVKNAVSPYQIHCIESLV